ncbi:hypothetical protein ACTPOK_00215 [Streptomyces inhibens]|uniref:hypothetical protein n=1 Tax=Streptomyces inhibens TaxID=2293571 RepID=UPI00402AAF8D
MRGVGALLLGPAVRPFLCRHAFHLAEFKDFHRLGCFARYTLACRVFGRSQVDAGIARIRAVLTAWGYQYGQDEDTTVSSVVSQLFLLKRSPNVEDLSTSLFARVRETGLLTVEGMRGLHPAQRAVATMGFSDQPPPEHQPKDGADGRGAGGVELVSRALVCHLNPDAHRPPPLPGDAVQGRPVARRRVPGRRQPGALDAADVRLVDRSR